MNILNEIRFLIVSVVSGVMGLLLPIKDFMYAMILLFAVNYVFGLVAGLVAGEGWSMKKSMVFFYHCALFFAISAFLFLIGHFLHAEGEAVGCVKTLCGIAIYFYTTNVVRNWRSMLVKNTTMYKVADAVYFILTMKVVERVPYVSEYLKAKKGGEDGRHDY